MPDWPLVGRAQDVAVLGELLTGAEPRSVVLAGPAGVGKTRLAQEGLRLAGRAGLATILVTATRAAAQVPFGTVAHLIDAAPPQPGDAGAPVDLLSRSIASLGARSAGRRLVLAVDDAHLLDDASATLVHQVVATGVATVMATVRSGEPAPDPVVGLWKDGLAERIEVGGLDGDAVHELLAAVLPGPVDPATTVELAERCQGNALFLRELVVGALDDGSLRHVAGIWRLTRDLSPSGRLVEIVEARLGRLDERERALMELVAYGEPLGAAELPDPALAERLERRGLLTSRVDGRRLRVHLGHPVYGDVVRARTPALRARAVAEELAAAVEASDSRRHEDRLRVATWRLAAGGGHPDVLLEGAVIALRHHDLPLAERLARAAGEAGAGFDARLLAARVTSLCGRRDDAERELAALAAAAESDTQRGRVVLARFDNHGVWSGHIDARLLDEAAGTIADADWHDRIAARRLVVALETLGPRDAAEAALALAGRARGEAFVFACLVGAYSLVRLGRLDAALDMSERGRAARQAVDTPLAWHPWWHTVTSSLALRLAGRFGEAEALAATGHREALAEGSAEAQALFAVLQAGGVGERGRVRTAAARAREAIALEEGLARPVLARHGHVIGALALALAGRPGEAAEMVRAIDAFQLPAVPHEQVDVLVAQGWTAAAGGDLPGARAHLERAAVLGREIGDRTGEVSALHGLARLGRSQQVADRLATVAAHIDGVLAPARARHARALADADAAALEAVANDFEAMGADLLAAEAFADAAVARRRAGQVREAAAAQRRAGLLGAASEDPVTPALQHALDVRSRLTPAERDTAALAAAGRTNREIAGQLHLSSRTVENRLQRVYEKLGVSGRGELADALEEGPAPTTSIPAGV